MIAALAGAEYGDDDESFRRFRFTVALRMIEDDPNDLERVIRYLDATEPVRRQP